MKESTFAYIVLCILALSGIFSLSDPQKESTSKCDDAIPFWSRGFARSCCDTFPTSFGKHSGGFFEAGVASDSTYFFNKKLKSGDVVYVITPDFPKFLEVFNALDSTARITLVTGSEDIGAPWEIFHPDRDNFFDYKMQSLWPKGQLMTMRQFLGDNRLLRWYAQNYDLVGKNCFTTSDVDPINDSALIAKVFPIPIGLDLHSLSEKDRHVSPAAVADKICDQRNDLASIVTKALPFLDRKMSVYARFDCAFPALKSRHMRKITRGELCRLLALNTKTVGDSSNGHIIYSTEGKHGKSKHSSQRGDKLQFWDQVAEVQFALAPPGFGMDTHRAWEILNLHSVPIIMSSPLDRLYSQFPVVIVKNWTEVFEDGSMLRFKSQIVQKFGSNPFNDKITYMLKASHWIDMIRNGTKT